VEQDPPRRAGGSDILTDIASPPTLLQPAPFGSDDPSTKFVPLHRRVAQSKALRFAGTASQRIAELRSAPAGVKVPGGAVSSAIGKL
jgi:hypothetical protein